MQLKLHICNARSATERRGINEPCANSLHVCNADAKVATVTETMNWRDYLDATSNGDFNNVIAEKVGVDPATIGRWCSGSVDPKPRQVVAYARAYSLNPLSALVAAGYLELSDLGDDVRARRRAGTRRAG